MGNVCTPCQPMVCYKYEDNGPAKGKRHDEAKVAKEGKEKKKDNEIQLKRIKSRELRGGIMYYSCHCIKRNGLQHDCRRTGCCGEPPCLVLPDPVCLPSQLARARGLADPAALAKFRRDKREKHDKYDKSSSSDGHSSKPGSSSSHETGKRFIVCEFKALVPEDAAEKLGICSKCYKQFNTNPTTIQDPAKYCTCPKDEKLISPDKPNMKNLTSQPDYQSTAKVALDSKNIELILKQIETKERPYSKEPNAKTGTTSKSVEEGPCMRPGCIHWKPPPPCLWDLPCKADCFETPVGLQPGRNPLTRGHGGFIELHAKRSKNIYKDVKHDHKNVRILTPATCYTGCLGSSGGGGGGAMSGGGTGTTTVTGGHPIGSGTPVLIMKLCN